MNQSQYFYNTPWLDVATMDISKYKIDTEVENGNITDLHSLNIAGILTYLLI